MGLACGFNIITPPKYDVIYPFVGQYAKVKSNGMFGLIDDTGKEIMPTQYEYIVHKGYKKIQFYRENIWYNHDFELHIFNQKDIYEEYRDSISNLLSIDRDNILITEWNDDHAKNEYIEFENLNGDENGIYLCKQNKVILSNYCVKWFNKEIGLAIICKNNKCGIANIHGNILVPLIYDELIWADYGLIAAEVGSKWGFIDINGIVRIDFNYELVATFYKEKTVVYLNGKCGLMDIYGNILTPIIYDSILFLKNDIILMIKYFLRGEKYEIYGKTEKTNFQHLYNQFKYNFDDNPELILAKSYSKYGIIKINGDVVLKAKYDKIYCHKNKNMLIVRLKEKHGIIDYNDNILLPIKYDYISSQEVIKDGKNLIYSIVLLNNKLGVINEKNEVRNSYPI